ncbi:hypothetical protein STSO111631_19325 [Stackebrandtia soli]
MLFPHTVTVYPSVARADIDGNIIRWAGPDGVPVPAFVQPRTATEDDTGPGQRARATFTAYLSRFCPPLDAWAAIEWEGRWYELDGEALDTRGLDGAVRHWKAHLRTVAGQ